MITTIKSLAEQFGDKLEIIPIDTALSIRKDLEKFRNENQLSDKQKWALNSSEFKGIPANTLSIIIMAIPFSIKANIIFVHKGDEYRVGKTVKKTMGKSREYIMNALSKAGYMAKVLTRLPMKRLAVQSSLAAYGRNNLTYVDDMGSGLSLAAIATGLPSEEIFWREPVVLKECDSCDICLNICLSGAINLGKFHIDSHKCKTCWKCMTRCPINAAKKVVDICFNEDETKKIINNELCQNISDELKMKIDIVGIDPQKPLPKYLQKLFEKYKIYTDSN